MASQTGSAHVPCTWLGSKPDTYKNAPNHTRLSRTHISNKVMNTESSQPHPGADFSSLSPHRHGVHRV